MESLSSKVIFYFQALLPWKMLWLTEAEIKGKLGWHKIKAISLRSVEDNQATTTVFKQNTKLNLGKIFSTIL